MNKIAYFGIIILTVLSCKTTKVSVNKNSKSNKLKVDDFEKIDTVEKAPYFKSSGTEPFWNLAISDDKIVFKTINDSIVTPHADPILVMDANVKSYRIQAKTAQLNIKILQQKCVNAMSGKEFPYAVFVEYKKSATAELEKVNGCGQYETDYRLHDIWVLEELNGEKIKKEDFSKEFPLLEIYANTNKFSGFAGCNQMKGSLFFEKGKLRFTNLATTKMMCEPVNKEAEFITALQSSSVYKIENNRLILSNSTGIKIIFKKVD
jgi:heat shock protein HslJ